MFAFQLAQDLKMTVSELGQRMTSEEFTHWMAFYSHKNREIRKQVEKSNPKKRR